jgi:hypothetical protein
MSWWVCPYYEVKEVRDGRRVDSTDELGAYLENQTSLFSR